jgi:hypothetical protein
MARRTCGAIRIHVTYIDACGAWRVHLSEAGRHLSTQWVSPPPYSPESVDSPQAYDAAAHAALSFAADDGVDLDNACPSDSGWEITRA